MFWCSACISFFEKVTCLCKSKSSEVLLCFWFWADYWSIWFFQVFISSPFSSSPNTWETSDQCNQTQQTNNNLRGKFLQALCELPCLAKRQASWNGFWMSSMRSRTAQMNWYFFGLLLNMWKCWFVQFHWSCLVREMSCLLLD